MTPAPDLIDRFRRDLDALIEPRARIGVAVSGGPDSLALLLLAAAARPGLVEAATVDHGLRPESAAEAAMVAGLCAELGIPHATLALSVDNPPRSNVQAWARSERYRALERWAAERDIAAIATAHHADDQSETLLMRLARGAGSGGLAGIQPCRPILAPSHILLIRPLLNWRRAELRDVVVASGIEPVDDPSNSDEQYDRTHARRLLAETPWIEPQRLAASAAALADAERALEWVADREFAARWNQEGAILDARDLPREVKRRLLVRALASFGCEAAPGPKLMAAVDTLDSGGTTTLASLKLEGGESWRISRAPPRRPR